MSELAKDTSSYIAALHNVAIVYYKLKDYGKALNYFLNCQEIKEKIGYQNDDDLILINISLCYAYLGKFSEAKLFVEKGLSLCGVRCSSHRILEGDFAKGVIYFGLKKFKQSEKYFLSSYLLAKKLNDTRFQLDNIDYLSQIFIQQKRMASATFYLNEAEALIRKNSAFNLEKIKIYSQFSQLYLKTKEYKKAAHYQMKYIQLKDSVYNEELTTNLMKTEAEYMERENTAKIATQSEIILLKEEMINRQWILNIVTGFLGFMTLTFLIFLFRNYQQKKNLNLMLDKKIEERTRELELSRDELLNAFKERDILIYRASEGITETINTIKGLCFIGIKDVSDPVARSYIDKIDKTSHHLASHLKSLFQEKIVVSTF